MTHQTLLTLGLDLGKNFGWFLLRNDTAVGWGTISSGDSDADRRRRELLRLFVAEKEGPVAAMQAEHLRLLDDGDDDHRMFLAVESPRVDFGAHKRGDSRELLRKALDTLDLWRLGMHCANQAGIILGAHLLLIEPEDGHCALHGSSRGDKRQAVKWANLRLRGTPGWTDLRVTKDNHLADAYGQALAGYAIAQRLCHGIHHPGAA